AAVPPELAPRVTRRGADPVSTASLIPRRPLRGRPWDSAALGLSSRVAGRCSVAFTVLYTGRRPDVDYRTSQRDTLPSYTRVDLAAQVDLVRPQGAAPGLAVVGKVENLFDSSYQEVTNFPARRRNVFFGGELRLGH